MIVINFVKNRLFGVRALTINVSCFRSVKYVKLNKFNENLQVCI